MVAVLDRLGRKADDADRFVLAEWRDRYLRLVSQMEDIDNLLSSVLSVNLTLVSVRQNEDMRKIAAWGAIGIAPTAMAGHLGHELRAHARAGLEDRVPARPCLDRDRLPEPLPLLPQGGLAVGHRASSPPEPTVRTLVP